jgi:hypothetical protein
MLVLRHVARGVQQMKKPKRKQPKFSYGQVVFYKTREIYVKLVALPDAEGYCLIVGHATEDWCHKSEIRPLTEKEIGPRRKRG